jgi:hypothetical protein
MVLLPTLLHTAPPMWGGCPNDRAESLHLPCTPAPNRPKVITTLTWADGRFYRSPINALADHGHIYATPAPILTYWLKGDGGGQGVFDIFSSEDTAYYPLTC